VNLYSASSWNL